MNQEPLFDPNAEPDDDAGEDEGTWDEGRWEQFLREGDKRSEEYMALLTMFGDEPDGHNIIARAMGWDHLVTQCGQPPSEANCRACDRDEECPFQKAQQAADAESFLRPADGTPPDAVFAEPTEEDWRAGPDEQEDEDEVFEPPRHPLIEECGDAIYAAYELFNDARPRGPSAAVSRLKHHMAAACGQLAAALDDDEFNLHEIGLTVAYLKRALRSICLALGALSEIQQGQLAEDRRVAELRTRVEAVRDKTGEQIQYFRRLFRARGDGTD
jgi:hypothetical protein